MIYFFDTNVIIDWIDAKLPVSAANKLANTIIELSLISKIELLGYHKITLAEQKLIESLLQISVIHPITDEVINRGIIIRKQFNINPPDAIIAATAIEHNLTFLTHNTKDFGKIAGLQPIDPYLL